MYQILSHPNRYCPIDSIKGTVIPSLLTTWNRTSTISSPYLTLKTSKACLNHPNLEILTSLSANDQKHQETKDLPHLNNSIITREITLQWWLHKIKYSNIPPGQDIKDKEFKALSHVVNAKIKSRRLTKNI